MKLVNYLVALLISGSVCFGQATNRPNKITGPGGATVSVESGNVNATPQSGGSTYLTSGGLYTPTVIDFSTTVSPTVSGSGHASVAFDGTNIKWSANGVAYSILGYNPANLPSDLATYSAATPAAGTFTTGTFNTSLSVPNGSSSIYQFRAGFAATAYFWQFGRDNAVSGDFLFSSDAGDNVPVERCRLLTAGGIAFGASHDAILLRDAANTLALRNGVNAQTFNVYNTYTDASNNEKFLIKGFGTSGYQIGSAAVGSGSVRPVYLLGSPLIFVSGSTSWTMSAAGHLTPGANNVANIGDGAGHDIHDLHAGGTVSMATLSVSGFSYLSSELSLAANMKIPLGQWIYWTDGNHYITSDGAALHLHDVNGVSVETPTFVVSGAATVQKLNISTIPTSATGLVSGDVWNSGGTLHIIP